MEVWAVWCFSAAVLWALIMSALWAKLRGRERAIRSVCGGLSESLGRLIFIYDGGAQRLTPVVCNYEAVFGPAKEDWPEGPGQFREYLRGHTEQDLFDKMDQGELRKMKTHEFCSQVPATGEEQWFSLQIVPISEHGNVRYFISLENCTEAKKVQGSLKIALQGAEQANRAKTFFLSRMSHEIRTPLNAIIGMQLIAQNHLEDPSKIRECLEKISRASQHLLELINDILDISKIESGKVELNQETFRLSELVQGVYDMVLERAAKKRQALILRSEAPPEKTYLGDTVRLRQVLLNILTNAVKYTGEAGRISFTVEQSVSTQPDYAHITFTVSDTGVGMSEEFLDRLFEPFEMEGRSSAEEGTGLGMAITKNIVHMMGGAIAVASKKGCGTTVTLELDLEQQQRETRARPTALPAAGPGPEVVFRGRRILLAEDNELNAEITTELLKGLGAVISRVENGEQAVSAFRYSASGTFDLILMDIQMPVMDGFRAAKAIRACKNHDSATIPIIALSADAFTEDVQRAKETGMNAHVSKPIDIDQLADVVWREGAHAV